MSEDALALKLSNAPDSSGKRKPSTIAPKQTQPSVHQLPDEHQPANELFIPVHGFVRLTDAEKAVVDHPAFQRLGEIFQLSNARFLYRGATHMRMEHAFGTLHVAQLIIDALHFNHRHVSLRASKKVRIQRERPLSDPPNEKEAVFIRLAALLHDIGHIPAGHTLEDELNVLNKHDAMQRLSLVFDRTDWQPQPLKTDVPPVTLRELINTNYSSMCPKGKVRPADLLLAIIAKDPKTISADEEFRLDICRDIVGNTICADLLDYLYRDWYHIGKPRYFETRILQYMEIRENMAGTPQFVISLGENPRIRSDAITQIVGLLESRFDLAESVLFHRTRASAAAMLERAIQELRFSSPGEVRLWDVQLEKTFLDVSDRESVNRLLQMAQGNGAATRPLVALLRRDLYSAACSLSKMQVSQRFETLLHVYGTPDNSVEEDERAAHHERIRLNRLNAVRHVERDLGFPQGSVAFYFPAKEMNAKIPDVQIHVDGQIHTFHEWNLENEKMMDAGHLSAQQDRFRRLWRAFVFVERHIYTNLTPEMKDFTEEVIKEMVFDLSSSQLTRDETAHKLAKHATTVAGCVHFGKELRPLLKAAQSPKPHEVYPFGAPPLNSFFIEG